MRHFGRILIMLTTLVMLATTSCVKRPKGVMSDEEMASLLADLELAGAVTSRDGAFYGDSARKVMRQSVFADHGITEKEYTASIEWYGRNMDNYAKVLDMAAEKVKKEQRKMSGVEDADMPLDAGLWPYGRMVMISPLSPTKSVRFSVDAPDIAKGDNVEWHLNASERQSLELLLGVDYSDGSKSYIYGNSNPNGKSMISVQTDSAKDVTRLFGMASASWILQGPVLIDSITITKSTLDKDRYPGAMSRQMNWERPEKKKLKKGEQTVKNLNEVMSKEGVKPINTVDSKLGDFNGIVEGRPGIAMPPRGN